MASRKPRTSQKHPKGEPLFVYVPCRRSPGRVLEIEHLVTAVGRRTISAARAEEAMSILEEVLAEPDLDEVG